MPQYTQGGVNPAALGVPDLYVNVNPPPAAALPGAASNVMGVVGIATWGPVNSPTVFGDLAGASQIFGYMQARARDLVTVVAAAVMQGANAFVGVRVTDGTDVAASATVQTNCLTLTAKYTGSRGNSLNAVIANGTAAGSYKITLSLPGVAPETFDNITGSGNALWVAVAAAINNGQSAYRGASNLVTATPGVGTTTPTLATITFAGGTDGVTSVTDTTLVGADTAPRTGMYALRGTGSSVFVLADCTTSTTWATQLAFAKSELSYAVCTSASGDTVSNFATTMASAGCDDPWVKVLLGDWVSFTDGQNNITRLISPQGFVAGQMAAISPALSELNRPLNGVSGTQSSLANKTYAQADLQSLASARGDVIVLNPPGGAYPAARFGRNTSSDPGRHQSAYTRYTNYLAKSMGQGLGAFVGRLITPDEMREAQSSIGSFLENEKQSNRCAAYSVQINANNNPQNQTALGVQKATVMVQYMGVVEYFLIDFTGGATVTPASALPLAA